MRPPEPLNTRLLIPELIRAIRGTRSQGSVSEALGYKGNQIYRWESGATRLLWTDFVRLCEFFEIGLASALERTLFYRAAPDQAAGVVRSLVGKTKLQDVATVSGFSRFVLGRWLNDKACPELADVLCLIETLTPRLTEFLGALVDIKLLPTVQAQSALREAERRIYYDFPWAAAVVRALDLAAYAEAETHDSQFIADRVGMPLCDVESAVQALVRVGAIVPNESGKYRAVNRRLHTNPDAEGFNRLRVFWLERVLEEMRTHGAPPRSLTGQAVFTVSDRAYRQIRDLFHAFQAEARALMEADRGRADVVGLLAIQLMDLGALQIPGATTKASDYADPARQGAGPADSQTH